jgi:ABC-type polysaccharide/polyol phosphate transport system ATPase subunit
MDPESTGWQNIIFRCVFLGLTFSEAGELAPSIGEFSELGEYLDLPVRTYSNGMFLRLAFAISTAVQPDIVVMDELIGAGDQSFLNKARKRVINYLSVRGSWSWHLTASRSFEAFATRCYGLRRVE